MYWNVALIRYAYQMMFAMERGTDLDYSRLRNEILILYFWGSLFSMDTLQLLDK